MILRVSPTDFLRGKILLPSSKSYSIRAFLIAACGGRSTIIHPSDCDDARVALKVSRQLGARVKHKAGNFDITASFRGVNPRRIFVGESGTVLRLLLPLLPLRKGKVTIIGCGTLVGRPNRFLVQTLRRMGIKIQGKGENHSVPITLEGGRLKGGPISIDGSLSSQFISALMTACPMLTRETKLTITGKQVVSETYIDMTRQILKKAGITIQKKSRRLFFIKGNQRFKGLKAFRVPSDYGLAAFFLVAAALLKSNITLQGNFDDRFIQADGEILAFLKRMGASLKKSSGRIHMAGPFRLRGGDFSLKNSPDLVPIMTVAALFAKGKTRLCDIGHVRAKESDRISDLKKELSKIGAHITEKQNEIIVYPRAVYKKNISLNPHRDHRLAMAFSVLGLKVGAKIKDIECVRKSYPNFFQDLKKIAPKVLKN